MTREATGPDLDLGATSRSPRWSARLPTSTFSTALRVRSRQVAHAVVRWDAAADSFVSSHGTRYSGRDSVNLPPQPEDQLDLPDRLAGRPGDRSGGGRRPPGPRSPHNRWLRLAQRRRRSPARRRQLRDRDQPGLIAGPHSRRCSAIRGRPSPRSAVAGPDRPPCRLPGLGRGNSARALLDALQRPTRNARGDLARSVRSPSISATPIRLALGLSPAMQQRHPAER